MAKLMELWHRVRDSLWLVPGLITVASVVLAVATTQVDATFVDEELAADMWWLFGGTAAGGRGVLSVIAGSIITVTGVVFSITIVALQLASTQLSPRVLRTFMADRWNQAVLGVFIGTFTYSLLVLRVVRQPGEEGDGGFLPSVSITTAVVLMLVSIGFLIFYIHHAARSIQAAAVVDRVTNETRGVIDRRFPPAGEVPSERPEAVIPAGEPAHVYAQRAGYIVRMDEGDMLHDLDDHGSSLVVRLERNVGDFVLAGETLMALWPAEDLDEDLAGALRDNVVQGPERTPHQDVQFGLIELVDVAVKALSPGINDPNTAVVVIDRLMELFQILAERELGTVVRRRGEGAALVATRPTFQTLLHEAIAPIRHYGAGAPIVALHLVHALDALAGQVGPEARGVVARAIADVVRQAAASGLDPADMDGIREAADRALETATVRAAPL